MTVLSAIVVTHRGGPLLDACLSSLRTALATLDAELLVVDNSEHGVRAEGARVLPQGRNAGFAGGVAAGLEAAAGEWILLVNDDAELEPDAATELLAAAVDGVGTVCGQVRFHARRDTINTAGLVVDRLGIAYDRHAGAPAVDGGAVEEVFGASACVVLYRRAMLDAIGGFDASFFAFGEDADVAWRARTAGWSCLYVPASVAYHHGSATAGEASARKYFLVGRNRMRLLAKNATGGQLALLGLGDGALRPRLRRVRGGDRPHARAADRPLDGPARVGHVPRARRGDPRAGAARAPERAARRVAPAQGRTAHDARPLPRAARRGDGGHGHPRHRARAGARRRGRLPPPPRPRRPARRGQRPPTWSWRSRRGRSSRGAAALGRTPDLRPLRPRAARGAASSSPAARPACGGPSTAMSLDRLVDALHDGHAFLCASERQRDLWTGTLLAAAPHQPRGPRRRPEPRRAARRRPVRRPRRAAAAGARAARALRRSPPTTSSCCGTAGCGTGSTPSRRCARSRS